MDGVVSKDMETIVIRKLAGDPVQPLITDVKTVTEWVTMKVNAKTSLEHDNTELQSSTLTTHPILMF